MDNTHGHGPGCPGCAATYLTPADREHLRAHGWAEDVGHPLPPDGPAPRPDTVWFLTASVLTLLTPPALIALANAWGPPGG